jgi:GNAT superfamily N-acetyltransferase
MQAYAEYATVMAPSAWAALDGAVRGALAADVKPGDAQWIVAERGGTVVGLLEFDRPEPGRAVIWKVYVDPPQQRTGVGRALVERYVGAVDVPEVAVEHDARDTGAAAFFDRLSFRAFAAGAGTVRRVRPARPR